MTGKTSCSECGELVPREECLSPVRCVMKVGHIAAHKLCRECWFKGKNGKMPFSTEDCDHSCPGCVKKLPNNSISKACAKNNEIFS